VSEMCRVSLFQGASALSGSNCAERDEVDAKTPTRAL
jgi:hypothetical protein